MVSNATPHEINLKKDNILHVSIGGAAIIALVDSAADRVVVIQSVLETQQSCLQTFSFEHIVVAEDYSLSPFQRPF